MKSRLTTLIAFTVALGGFHLPALQADNHGGGHGHSEIGEQMEMIGKTFRSLRREARDPANNAKAADLVAKMLKGAQASLGKTPSWTAEQPADKQEAFVASYEKEMKVFVGLLTDLEKAFRDGNHDKAGELIQALRDQQRDSHKAFKKPDED
jgi:hypothetical protein